MPAHDPVPVRQNQGRPYGYRSSSLGIPYQQIPGKQLIFHRDIERRAMYSKNSGVNSDQTALTAENRASYPGKRPACLRACLFDHR